MKTRPQSKIQFFLACSFLVLLISLYQVLNFTPPTEKTESLGELQPAFGSMSIQRNSQLIKIKNSSELHHLDELLIGPESQAVLSLMTGHQLRFFSDTRALISKNANKIKIILFSGDLQDESVSTPKGDVIISTNNLHLSLAQYEKKKNRSPKIAPIAKKNNSEKNKLLNLPTRSLTVESIQNTMRAQKNNFFRCYSQLLQKTPGVSGEASLSFTIQQTGHVSQAEVATSSLKDPEFKRCLSEALKRVEFKSFAGESVQALFPLRFE